MCSEIYMYRYISCVVVFTEAYKGCSGVYQGMWCIYRHVCCVVAYTKVSVYHIFIVIFKGAQLHPAAYFLGVQLHTNL